MIGRIDISGKNYELTPEIKKYVTKKISKLDKYMPRRGREGVYAEVTLKRENTKSNKQNKCEVVLVMPHEKVMASESTLNMFAAVDIVEAKLKNQLSKNKHSSASAQKLHQRFISKIRRK
jgi:putative sigma-54 modulation protein